MNFEEVLLEAIDEGFSWIGESEKRMIYFYLETKYKIKRQDIIVRLGDFTEAIEDIFGSGARLLEIKIMESLFKKIGYIHPFCQNLECLEFTNYIESARMTSNRIFPLKAISVCTSH